MDIKVGLQRAEELLTQLVRIPSVNPHFPGGVPEQQMADFMVSFFTHIGLQVEERVVFTKRTKYYRDIARSRC
ncbi:MAG: hypothetical protein RR595_13430 [Lysinibacillus sp.]